MRHLVFVTLKQVNTFELQGFLLQSRRYQYYQFYQYYLRNIDKMSVNSHVCDIMCM